MKRNLIILVSAALLFVSGVVITSCGNQEQSATHESREGEEAHEHAVAYSCPMKCEGETTYAEAGNCSKCGMALEAVTEGHDHEGHEH